MPTAFWDEKCLSWSQNNFIAFRFAELWIQHLVYVFWVHPARVVKQDIFEGVKLLRIFNTVEQYEFGADHLPFKRMR